MKNSVGKLKKGMMVSLATIMMFGASSSVFAGVPNMDTQIKNGVKQAVTYDGLDENDIKNTFVRDGEKNGVPVYRSTKDVIYNTDGSNAETKEELTAVLYLYLDAFIEKAEEDLGGNYDGGARYRVGSFGNNKGELECSDEGKVVAYGYFDYVKETDQVPEPTPIVGVPRPEDPVPVETPAPMGDENYEFPDYLKDGPTNVAKPNYRPEVIAKVYKLYNKGVIGGDQNGMLKPYKNLSRAEFAKILVVAFGLEGTGESEGFVDTKGHWAESVINVAVDNGLLKGVGEGKFDPNASVTLEQASAIMVRLYEQKGISLQLSNEQLAKCPSELTWGKESYCMCWSASLFEGVTMENPTSPLCKVDGVVAIANLLELVEEQSK